MVRFSPLLSKLFSLKVSQNGKIAIVLVYALALLTFELFYPVSFIISRPFAIVVYLLMKSFSIPSLSLIHSSVIINETMIDFTDLCTGVPVMILTALFMWVGKISKGHILALSLSLLLLNISRAVLVAHLLVASSYDVAAAAHNLSYTMLTATVLTVMVYSLSRSIPLSSLKV